jgi:hypothetical protein
VTLLGCSLPRPLCIINNGKEFLRLSTPADVRDFLKHIPRERRHSPCTAERLE